MDIGQLLAGFPTAQPGIPLDKALPPGAQPLQQPVGQPPPLAPPQAPAPGQMSTGGPIEALKGAWRGFFQKMDTDPNFKMAVLQTGLGMLKSPQVGQNGFDVAANALGTGVATLQGLRDKQKQEAIQAEDRSFTREMETKKVQNQTAGVEIQQEMLGETKRGNKVEEAQRDKQLNTAYQQYLETVRSNKAQEAIEMAKARYESEWRKIYGQGTVPADIQKVEILAAEYRRANPNLSEVEARAQALKEVQTTGKEPPFAKNFTTIFSSQMQAWMMNPENIGKEPSPEQVQGMIARARAAAQAAESGNTSMATPPPATAPNPQGVPAPAAPPTPGGGPQDAQVRVWVNRQKAAGVNPQIMRDVLIGKGLNPADYGL